MFNPGSQFQFPRVPLSLLSESPPVSGENLLPDHHYRATLEAQVCAHPETSGRMPLGLLMKTDNHGVKQTNTIAAHDWAPAHLEGCKAGERTAQEMIFAHWKDSMEGTFEIDHIYTSGSHKWNDKSLSSQVCLWQREWLVYRVVSGADRLSIGISKLSSALRPYYSPLLLAR